MYKCLDCGKEFEEPKNYSEDRTPNGGFGEIVEHYTGCPYCEGAYELIEEQDYVFDEDNYEEEKLREEE